MSDLPVDAVEWGELWEQIVAENNLTTDRECYQFLTQMVLGITSTMAEMEAIHPEYFQWKIFVDLVFEEWTYYDVRLNEHND